MLDFIVTGKGVRKGTVMHRKGDAIQLTEEQANHPIYAGRVEALRASVTDGELEALTVQLDEANARVLELEARVVELETKPADPPAPPAPPKR